MPTDFETEWSKAHRSVLRRCQRTLLHPDDVEDVYREVWLKAFSNYQNFRGECAFATWANQIARRQIIDANRRRLRDWKPLPPEEEPAAPVDPRKIAIDNDVGEDGILNRAVAAGVISQTEATLIQLRAEDPQPGWAEIESLLAIRNGATLHMRARQRLQVFILLRSPELVGGLSRIRWAFQRASLAKTDPLTEAEKRVFSEYVLREKPRHRTVLRDRELRSACLKVSNILRDASGGEK